VRRTRLAAVLAGSAILVGGAAYVPAAATEDGGTSCQNSQAKIAAIPKKVVDSWAIADAHGIASAFTADADFISGDGTYVHGSANLEPYYAAQFLPGGFLHDTRVTADVNKIVCLDRDNARIITLGGPLFPGDVVLQPQWRGIQSWVAVRSGNTWKAQSFHNTRTNLTELPPQ
jgi:uncharacterized protein (TIGR02246 family)